MLLSRIIIRVFVVLNILAVVGMIFSYMAGYVNPVSASWVSLFSLAYPYFIAINIVFALAWLFVKKWYFVLSALVLLLGLKTIKNNFQFLPTKGLPVSELSPLFKVMSYNVHVFDLYSWSKNEQTRDNMFRFIRQEAPHVACFQEYYDNKKKLFSIKDSLIENQKFKYAHIYYTDRVGSYQRFGIATYSQYPILKKGLIRFPNSSNVSIFTDVLIAKDTLRVFNCHLESIRFKPEDYNFIDSVVQQRREQLKGAKGVYERLSIAYKKRAVQAGIVAKAVKQSPYPVILCGDFNDPPSSFTYYHLKENLNDSFVFKGRGKGATYSRNIFSYRIDYILFSHQLNCVKFKVPKVDYSDHLPVVGEYQIN